MLFVLLINVKMPTIVGILTFMSRKNEHENFFITSGPGILAKVRRSNHKLLSKAK